MLVDSDRIEAPLHQSISGAPAKHVLHLEAGHLGLAIRRALVNPGAKDVERVAETYVYQYSLQACEAKQGLPAAGMQEMWKGFGGTLDCSPAAL